MDCSKKQKYQVLFMWLYVFGVYLPFFIYMFIKHDVSTTPISLIGWDDGIHYLIIYLILTLPFIIFQVFFFNRHFIGNNKLISYVSVISSIFIIIGAFIPVIQTKPKILFAHTFVSVTSTIILMLTIMFALILHALKKKQKVVLLALYGLYVIGLLTGFYIYYTAALFQLASAMSFILILLFINTKSIK
jgi:hypothetical protein